MARDDETHDDDPFDGVTLDDAFVDGASVREATAEERVARLQRIDTEHRRLVAEARERAALADASLADAVPAARVAPHRARRRPWAVLVLVALVAIGLWGAGAIGYFRAPMGRAERGLAVIAACFLVAAVPVTDAIGFVLTAALGLYHTAASRAYRTRTA